MYELNQLHTSNMLMSCCKVKVDVFDGDFASQKPCRRWDTNPRSFDPVVLNHSYTFLTGLGPFWLAQSVRPQLKASTVGDPADAALATLSVASNQI